MYLGSNIFKGTLVLGKKIKLDNGNTGIFSGNFSFFVIIIFINYTMNKSNLIETLLKLGISAAEQGKIEEAKEAFLKIITINPNILLAYINLVNIDEKILKKKNFEKVREITNDPLVTNHQKAIGNFILSIYEKRNRKFKDEINLLDKAYYYLENSKTKINHQSNYFFQTLLPKFFSKKKYIIDSSIAKKNNNFNPIFIIGLPRTGSTLVESILSSSQNNIPSCGESNIFNSTILKELQKNNSLNKDFRINDFEFKIDFNFFSRQIKKKYENLFIFNEKKNFFFIDKSLENFFYIDLILDIFPKAKFIHCKRNLFHTSIAIYQKFLIHLGWANSYNDILNYINNYLKVIKFYKKIFSRNIYDLELEDFTKNSDKKAKEIFDFCNIKWDKNSLNFYKREDLKSKTASTIQIRNNIYSYDENRFYPYRKLGFKFSNDFNWLKEYL